MQRFLLALLITAGLAYASPSVFPENAIYGKFGYNNGVAAAFGGEFVVPVPFWDGSLGLEVFADDSDLLGVKLTSSSLIFPAIGTTPPIALGLGSDIGYDSEGFFVHGGITAGSDLLFVFDVPVTISTYVAIGYADDLSFAWGAQLRYYFDDIALELATSDTTLVSFGMRFFFY